MILTLVFHVVYFIYSTQQIFDIARKNSRKINLNTILAQPGVGETPSLILLQLIDTRRQQHNELPVRLRKICELFDPSGGAWVCK